MFDIGGKFPPKSLSQKDFRKVPFLVPRPTFEKLGPFFKLPKKFPSRPGGLPGGAPPRLRRVGV